MPRRRYTPRAERKTPFNRNYQANQTEQVTLQNADKIMAAFIKYYKGINLVPEDEWKHFFESLFTDVPFCFRITENHRKINNVFEGKPGTLGQAEVVREYFKNNILPQISDIKINDEPFELTPLPWFPKQLAWKSNVDGKTLHQNEELKTVNQFVTTEDKASAVCKQDIASMVPPLMVDINPNHKILEMCSAPGFQTMLILEQLCNNPKKIPDGFLVSNDVDYRINYRWSQGSNVFFTHEDARKYPDLYLTDDHSPENKVLYDRIFLDAPSSNDGGMRSRNHRKLRSTWNVTKAQKSHKDLKAMLRRGVELLEMNGQLVYCTTSMNPIENEAVVAAILAEAPQTLELVDVRNRLPDFHTRPGMSTWKVMSQGLVFYDSFDTSPQWFQKENEDTLFPPKAEDLATLNLDRCVRVMPHDNDTGAFFVAVITKMGPLPWQQEEEMEVTEVKKESGEAKAEEKEKKCPYTLPIRVDCNVVVSEIEWTTEVTDDKLTTKAKTDTSRYELAPLKISKSCIPPWLSKKKIEESAKYEDVSPDDPGWVQYKELLDIKRINPLPNMLKFSQEGKITMYMYCNPAVKSLIQNNLAVSRKSKAQCGGLTMMRVNECGTISVISVLPVIQNIGKRLVNVTKADLIPLFENKEVAINDLSPKLQTDLNNIPDNGSVYFLYEPKGKNADPKCAIMIWREKSELTVKDKSFSQAERHHGLRLCGIDPQVNSAEADAEVKSEPEDNDEETPIE